MFFPTAGSQSPPPETLQETSTENLHPETPSDRSPSTPAPLLPARSTSTSRDTTAAHPDTPLASVLRATPGAPRRLQMHTLRIEVRSPRSPRHRPAGIAASPRTPRMPGCLHSFPTQPGCDTFPSAESRSSSQEIG